MRDYVEIGIGRKARRTYSLEAITVLPTRRTRSSKEVDTSWNIDAYSFDIPFVSHPTDAIADPEFAIEMDRLGGMGVINAEGLLGRHVDVEAAIDQVVAAARDENGEFSYHNTDAIAKLQELHAAPLDTDLLSERISQIRAAGATVAVRVSPQNAAELAPVVIKAGADLLFIQGTLLSAEHYLSQGEPLNLKEFIASLDIPVIVGGVSDYTTAMHMMRTGAVGVIVGAGDGINGGEALGIQPALATAIADVAVLAGTIWMRPVGAMCTSLLTVKSIPQAMLWLLLPVAQMLWFWDPHWLLRKKLLVRAIFGLRLRGILGSRVVASNP